MNDLTQIVRDVLAYEEEQISLHQYRKSAVLIEIELVKHWEEWLGDFVLYLKEHGAVKELPDRFVISVDKLRKAVIREPSIKDRPLIDQHYEKLRKLARQEHVARFGRGLETIELINPNPELLKSFLPPEYKYATEPKENDKPTIETTLVHKIGEIVKGADIKCANATDSYIWQACPICGKQEWVRLRKNGRPHAKRCTDCLLFRRHLPSHTPRRKNGAGYVSIHLESTDFFYPMVSRAGYVLEHRLIMAKDLGRCLQSWEVVHHKNGHKTDNRLENLELVASIGEHISNHNTGYIGGYNHGLHDGRSAHIKQLRDRITQLEAQVPESFNML